MKLPTTPRIVGDKSLFFALKDVAVAVNALIDLVKLQEALPEYADDAAATAGGLPLHGFYRTGSVIKQRVA